MDALGAAGTRLVTPRSVPLWTCFLALWTADAITTVLLFLTSHGTELNPVTTFLHDLFGLPGAALAAVAYAAIVIAVGRRLADPTDRYFLGAVVAGYVLFVANNAILLATGIAPVSLLLGA